MLSRFRTRRSAITFDVGAAGLRAYQLRQRGPAPALCDALQFERTPTADAVAPAAPAVDPAQLDRLIGQGHFAGRDVGLVLSPPDVQFFPLRLPTQALSQAPERIEQALKWEVAQQSRGAADDLEVRHWRLPHSAGQQANVMAVAAPAELVLRWCGLLQQHHLSLRRIDVSPCALVRLCRAVWTPADQDLWGVLDLGLRHSTLTVVVGTVPTYVRCLSISTHQWTRKLAEAFEVTCTIAEQLKRQQPLQSGDRGIRTSAAGGSDGHGLQHAADLSSAFWGVLRESIQTLALEVGRCFSYVMHTFPDHSVKRLFLAGGGAGLSGLPGILAGELGIPVVTLATVARGSPPPSGESPAPQWEHPLAGIRLEPQAAAALGGALLDLEAS